MKNFFTILLIAVLPIISCTQDNEDVIVPEQNTTFVENISKVALNLVPTECHSVELIAGQHFDAGGVFLRIEAGYLIVAYESQDDWEIDETHLYVGAPDGVPMNNQGNPKIGHFPYSGSHPDGTTDVVYSISLSTLPPCVLIAAHASVSIDVPGEPYQQETAWGEGPTFLGKSWAMYFNYCLIECQSY